MKNGTYRPNVTFRLAPDAEVILGEMEKVTSITRTKLINRAILETYSDKVGKRVLGEAEKAKEAA